MRNINLEQFYTKTEVAKACIAKISLAKFDRIIEPSAGNGSFSKQMNCEAYDICPMDNSIIKQDFLTFEAEKGNILVIGNPPFGRQSSLAIKFINHAAKFSKVIAFILPLSFSKESTLNKLDKHVFLLDCFELPSNSFYFENETYNIPCGFYIFEVKDEERPETIKYTTNDFSFVKKEEADFSIRRVGANAGKIENLDVSKESHYFIKDNANSLDILKDLKYNDANKTVGPKSLSKNEIIKAYLERKNGKEK